MKNLLLGIFCILLFTFTANAQKVDAINEAKKKAQAMSNEELAAELERRVQE